MPGCASEVLASGERFEGGTAGGFCAVRAALLAPGSRPNSASDSSGDFAIVAKSSFCESGIESRGFSGNASCSSVESASLRGELPAARGEEGGRTPRPELGGLRSLAGAAAAAPIGGRGAFGGIGPLPDGSGGRAPPAGCPGRGEPTGGGARPITVCGRFIPAGMPAAPVACPLVTISRGGGAPAAGSGFAKPPTGPRPNPGGGCGVNGAGDVGTEICGAGGPLPMPGGGTEIGDGMPPASSVGEDIDTVDSPPSSSSGNSSPRCGSAILKSRILDYRKPRRLRSFRALCRDTSTRLAGWPAWGLRQAT